MPQTVWDQLEATSLRGPRRKEEHLKNFIRDQVTAGLLKPGDPLPSEPKLAEALNVARGTVRMALGRLEQEGFISRVHGKGSFVRDHVPAGVTPKLSVFALVTHHVKLGYYPALLDGFQSASQEANHQVMVCCTDNDLGRQADVILQLLDKKIGGLAIVPVDTPPTQPHQIRQLHERGIPVVYCHRPVEGVKAPLLAIPFDETMRVAARALLQNGHRRMAFISNPSSLTWLSQLKALRQVIEAGGGQLPDEFVYHGEIWTDASDTTLDESAIRKGLEAMCRRPDRPTAIVTTWDPVAEVIYFMLGDMGLRVPEDISLLGSGGTWRPGATIQRLTSTVVDEAELGRHAVNLLREMQSGRRPLDSDEVILMPVTLSDGQTLGPAPG